MSTTSLQLKLESAPTTTEVQSEQSHNGADTLDIRQHALDSSSAPQTAGRSEPASPPSSASASASSLSSKHFHQTSEKSPDSVRPALDLSIVAAGDMSIDRGVTESKEQSFIVIDNMAPPTSASEGSSCGETKDVLWYEGNAESTARTLQGEQVRLYSNSHQTIEHSQHEHDTHGSDACREPDMTAAGSASGSDVDGSQSSKNLGVDMMTTTPPAVEEGIPAMASTNSSIEVPGTNSRDTTISRSALLAAAAAATAAANGSMVPGFMQKSSGTDVSMGKMESELMNDSAQRSDQGGARVLTSSVPEGANNGSASSWQSQSQIVNQPTVSIPNPSHEVDVAQLIAIITQALTPQTLKPIDDLPPVEYKRPNPAVEMKVLRDNLLETSMGVRNRDIPESPQVSSQPSTNPLLKALLALSSIAPDQDQPGDSKPALVDPVGGSESQPATEGSESHEATLASIPPTTNMNTAAAAVAAAAAAHALGLYTLGDRSRHLRDVHPSMYIAIPRGVECTVPNCVGLTNKKHYHCTHPSGCRMPEPDEHGVYRPWWTLKTNHMRSHCRSHSRGHVPKLSKNRKLPASAKSTSAGNTIGSNGNLTGASSALSQSGRNPMADSGQISQQFRDDIQGGAHATSSQRGDRIRPEDPLERRDEKSRRGSDRPRSKEERHHRDSEDRRNSQAGDLYDGDYDRKQSSRRTERSCDAGKSKYGRSSRSKSSSRSRSRSSSRSRSRSRSRSKPRAQRHAKHSKRGRTKDYGEDYSREQSRADRKGSLDDGDSGYQSDWSTQDESSSTDDESSSSYSESSSSVHTPAHRSRVTSDDNYGSNGRNRASMRSRKSQSYTGDMMNTANNSSRSFHFMNDAGASSSFNAYANNTASSHAPGTNNAPGVANAGGSIMDDYERKWNPDSSASLGTVRPRRSEPGKVMAPGQPSGVTMGVTHPGAFISTDISRLPAVYDYGTAEGSPSKRLKRIDSARMNSPILLEDQPYEFQSPSMMVMTAGQPRPIGERNMDNHYHSPQLGPKSHYSHMLPQLTHSQSHPPPHLQQHCGDMQHMDRAPSSPGMYPPGYPSTNPGAPASGSQAYRNLPGEHYLSGPRRSTDGGMQMFPDYGYPEAKQMSLQSHAPTGSSPPGPPHHQHLHQSGYLRPPSSQTINSGSQPGVPGYQAPNGGYPRYAQYSQTSSHPLQQPLHHAHMINGTEYPSSARAGSSHHMRSMFHTSNPATSTHEVPFGSDSKRRLDNDANAAESSNPLVSPTGPSSFVALRMQSVQTKRGERGRQEGSTSAIPSTVPESRDPGADNPLSGSNDRSDSSQLDRDPQVPSDHSPSTSRSTSTGPDGRNIDSSRGMDLAVSQNAGQTCLKDELNPFLTNN